MSVVRVHKNKNYTVMSNNHLRNKNMSLKAKGLLSVMLSLPDDWDYSVNGLTAICKESKHTIESTLKELKEFGYLVVDKLLPNQTKIGRYEYIYNVYEEPKQDPKNQGIEIQGIEVQGVESCPQLNTNKQITNKQNTNKTNFKEKDKKEIPIIFDYENENGERVMELGKGIALFENKDEQIEKITTETIEYLNNKTNKRFSPKAKGNRTHIKARLNDGYTIDDLKHVIDVKAQEWLNTDMDKFLNTETLFRPSKFEKYLNQQMKTVDNMTWNDYWNMAGDITPYLESGTNERTTNDDSYKDTNVNLLTTSKE